MRRYCDVCEKEVDTKVIAKKEHYLVLGEIIDVDARVLVCAECGEELFCEELDNETLLNAYNKYRAKHKLLMPDEIKGIREQYGLSQRGMSKLLGWGDKTIRRYENGAVQDKAHNSLLVFLKSPENMKSYIMENETSLDEKQKSQLLSRIEKSIESNRSAFAQGFLENLFGDAPSIENGFKAFDYDKFCNMVLFFSSRGMTMLKVKLFKLLNYADMIFYKENGVSMSGARYVHLPYGPVPQHYNTLFGMMESDGTAHIDVEFERGYEKHQIIPDRDIADGSLSGAEIDVLDRVYKKFISYGSAEISEYSHKEKGYASTSQGDVISYAFAKDIVL